MGRMREVTRVRSLMAQAIRRAGRAPGKGPGTVKRLAYSLGCSRQYAHRIIQGEGCLQAARETLHRLVTAETDPFPVVESVRLELMATMAKRLTDQELRDRLRHAKEEALVTEGCTKLAVWLHEAHPSRETLREAIAAVQRHMWDLAEVHACLQAIDWRLP